MIVPCSRWQVNVNSSWTTDFAGRHCGLCFYACFINRLAFFFFFLFYNSCILLYARQLATSSSIERARNFGLLVPNISKIHMRYLHRYVMEQDEMIPARLMFA